MSTDRLLVRVENLHYRYEDGTPALSGIDFQLRHGETAALLGANGSGKTTFLLHLNGLLRGEGRVEIDGLPVEPRHFQTVRRKVGFLFQDPDDQMFMASVFDDVAFGLRQSGQSGEAVQAKVESALAAMQLTALATRPPYHLSAGEKQRAALAGILVLEPDLLVLDEPSTHLDPPARRLLIDLLRGLPQAKILVTHDLAMAQELAARAVFFEKGTARYDGSVADVIARAGWAS
jgi:cobalt/nickel transport system ATP-binding protein